MKQQYNAITPTVVIPVPEEKLLYLKVTYLVDDSLLCLIVLNPNNILAIKIDGGEEIPWIVPDSRILTFKTPGEHTVEFILETNTMVGGMLDGDFSPITNIEFPEVEFNIAAGSISDLNIKSLVIPETVENFQQTSPLLELETVELNCKVLGGGSFCNFSYFPKLKNVKIGKNCQLTTGGSFSNLRILDKVYLDGTIAANGFFGSTPIKELIIGNNFKGSSQTGSFGGSLIYKAVVKDVSETFNMSFFSNNSYLKKIEFHCKKLTNTTTAYSFSDSLEEVIIGNEVEEIVSYNDFYFLYNCYNIKKILLGHSLKKLSYFLCNLLYLEELEIPSNIKELGEYTFYNVGSQVNFKIKFNGPIILKAYSFYSGTIVPTLDLPVGSKVEDNAFSANACPLTIKLRDGGRCIDRYLNTAFNTYSSKVKKIEFGGTTAITHDAKYTMDGISGVSELYFSPSINKISDRAFRGWYGLYNIQVPETVEYIGKEAFWNCSNALLIFIGAKEIGEAAFTGCSNCLEVNIKSEIIGKEAFKSIGNYNTKFYFSENLREIGESAFEAVTFNNSYCLDILDIYNCKVIKDKAFKNIGAGLGLKINLNKVEEIGNEAFYNVHLPLLLNLSNIKSIGDRAFYGCSYILNLYLGDNLKYLGEEAFAGCTNIRKVIIPDLVEVIPVGCFRGISSGLTYVSIGKNVRSIDSTAFNYCAYLYTIEVDKENKTYDSREDCNAIIETRTNTLVLGCKNSFIPESIEKINDKAFYTNNGFSLTVLPLTPPTINDDPFLSALLTALYVPLDSVLSYKEAWSNYISKIKSINTIKTKVYVNTNGIWTPYNSYVFSTTIDDNEKVVLSSVPLAIGDHDLIYEFKGENIGSIFTTLNVYVKELEILSESFNDNNISGSTVNLSLLDKITITETNPNFDSRNNCNAVILTSTNTLKLGCTSTIIPESVTSIGANAFKNSPITSINIGNNITSIDTQAFYNCTKLSNITISENLTSIGTNIFTGCLSLPYIDGVLYADTFAIKCDDSSNILLKADTKYINNDVFRTKSFDIWPSLPNGLRIIGLYAFSNSNIPSVTIPGSVVDILGYAFNFCTSLTTVVIESGVTKTGTYMFYNCSNLTSVTLPDTLTTIESCTFGYCSKLSNITIPRGVTTINSNAFVSCNLLKEITIDSNALTSKTSYTSTSNNFYKLFGNLVTKYIFTDNIQTIGKYICYGLSNLETIEIETGITSINTYAFYNCSKLNTIIVKATTPPILGTNAFNIAAPERKIYVPADSVATYKAASGWSTYASLIEAIPTE